MKYYNVCYTGFVGICMVIGANYGILNSKDNIIGPAISGGAIGTIIGITSPITIPVAVLCSPSILYRMYKGK